MSGAKSGGDRIEAALGGVEAAVRVERTLRGSRNMLRHST